ncbi:MAG TPA: hypothetical protein VG604_03500 [Candidatus Saccharimonadales bacterium]|nr:hypothetical protein [Candidatus Saccharimonadales bacterium]
MGKLNSKGFGAVEILLVVLILLIAGLGGYYVYHNQNSTKPAAKTSATTKSDKTKTVKNLASDPYAGWQTLTGTGFTMKYPAGWKTKNCTDTSGGDQRTCIYIASPDLTTHGHLYTIATGAEFKIFYQAAESSYTSIQDYTSTAAQGKYGVLGDIGNIKVDGIDAIRANLNALGGGPVTELIHNGQFWQIEYSIADSESSTTAKYLNEYNNFVQSLKFN